MVLEKMTALAQHLISKNIFSVESFDYWMENGLNEYCCNKQGKGFVVGRFTYDAVLNVERFSQDASLFLALINIWINENDSEREKDNLELPRVDVTPLDDDTVDVEVTIRFLQDITIMPQDSGPIVMNGQHYGVASLINSDANKVGVGDTQERPTDKPYERD